MKSDMLCPVCNTHSFSILYQYTASQAATHFCSALRDADRNRRLEKSIRRLWNGKECRILQCGNCGFSFADPFVGGDEDFYSILYEEADYPAWRWDYDVALHEVLFLRKGGTILDIGAGFGKFLAHLSKEWQCYGVEASEVNRSRLETIGIKVFCDLSEAMQVKTGAFEVITLFQVLEHVSEFHKMLVDCRRLLCAGGQLVVTVPDGDAMIRQERITGCADMPPNHVCKWTPKSLTMALKEAGFVVQKIMVEPSSWRKVKGNVYLKICADAQKSHSLAAQIYRLRSRRLRAPLLACLGFSALLRMLPHVRNLRTGGAFAVVAEAC
ncbi:MAG: class I SAM-dependent methyltransferase [Chlamydiae bacterium]|nr:class I SAM-dependent methyltransferase [Chlamydiota bacterium]MBI3276209.1 class I SAM-dependent methyltransferase [Chlamydiota bacterium]